LNYRYPQYSVLDSSQITFKIKKYIINLRFHKKILLKVEEAFLFLNGEIVIGEECKLAQCGINHRRLNIEDRRKNRTTLA
jgi:predicted metalloprotease